MSEVVSGTPDLEKRILLKQPPIFDIKKFEEVLRKSGVSPKMMHRIEKGVGCQWVKKIEEWKEQFS